MRETPIDAASGRPSVLIVDDDPGDLLLTEHVLRSSHQFGTILTAESADEALAMFRDYERSCAEHPDAFPPLLVLLDIAMPGRSGHDFLREFSSIRECGNYDSVVIAMLSSSTAEEDRRSSGAYEFVVDYLVKPLQLQDVESICRVLEDLSEPQQS